MRRGLLFLAVGVGAIVVLVAVLRFVTTPPNEHREVANAVYAAVVDAGNGGTIDMGAVAPFEWDRMYQFGAYTPDDYVSETLGFPWGTGDSLRLPNDGFVLLIFARDRTVTGWVVLNDYESKGPLVQFDDALLDVPIPRASAVFRSTRDAEQTTGGWDIFTLGRVP